MAGRTFRTRVGGGRVLAGRTFRTRVGGGFLAGGTFWTRVGGGGCSPLPPLCAGKVHSNGALSYTYIYI